jgi:hypothetical protein
MNLNKSLPNFQNYQVLYSGKRYVVFAVDDEHPYKDYEQYANIIIFDKKYQKVFGNSLRDASRANSYEFNGSWESPINDGEEFHCNGIEELVKLIYQRTRDTRLFWK